MVGRDLLLALTIVSMALCSSNAFFFGREEAVAMSNGREVDEECLAKADEGSCEFYTCFERRLPCGRDWYILRQGLYYCNKIERVMDTFPEEAQTFLRESQRCLMQSLKDIYREDVISCHNLEHQAVDAISSCYIDNAFCARLRGNYAEFFSIYEMDDLFSSGSAKVWREIVSLATECGGDAIQGLSADAHDVVTGALDSAMDSLRDRWNSIFKRR